MSSINLETANPPPTRPVTDQVTLDGSDLHVLRLCLDLQLDALLLAVGAVSGPSAGSEPPWRRWVDEDIQLAYSLAADVRMRGVGPPSGLGSKLNRDVPSTIEDGLHARYSSMAALLSGVMSRHDGHGVGQEDLLYQGRPQAAQALQHCRKRLAELETHAWSSPVEQTPDQPWDKAGATYLPGELLG
jgi:hypothetical protein